MGWCVQHSAICTYYSNMHTHARTHAHTHTHTHTLKYPTNQTLKAKTNSSLLRLVQVTAYKESMGVCAQSHTVIWIKPTPLAPRVKHTVGQRYHAIRNKLNKWAAVVWEDWQEEVLTGSGGWQEEGSTDREWRMTGMTPKAISVRDNLIRSVT